MTGDILLEGLPALKIDDRDYLIYSPYKRLFVRIPVEAIYDPIIHQQLKNGGFFKFPQSSHSSNTIKIVLNITKKCNLFCSYCWANSSPYVNQKMSPNIAMRIVRNVGGSKRIERIHFMGGEPTLDFETIETVVTYLNNSDIYPPPMFYVTTNGVMSDRIREWLIDHKFAFSISWDGLQEAHNKQRSYANGKGSEQKVKTSILRVAEEGLPLRIRMTVSKLNLAYLCESVRWLAFHGVKFVHMEAVAPDGRGSEFVKSYAPDPEEFADEFFRVVELAEERGISVMNSHLANLYTLKNYYCSSLKGRVYNFNPDGSISHCYKVQGHNDHLANHFVVGEYQNEGELIKINQKKSVRLSSTNVSKYPECEDYFLKYLYSGGCPNRNFMTTGSWNKVDQDMRQMNSLLLRRAIVHIYKRALEGKGTALEGYILFYQSLTRERVQSRDYDIPAPPSDNFYSVEFIPIPMFSQNPSVEIDSCDICI